MENILEKGGDFDIEKIYIVCTSISQHTKRINKDKKKKQKQKRNQSWQKIQSMNYFV
jgi:hypothetical protein